MNARKNIITCQHLGYSQSRSKPSKPYWSMNWRDSATNLVLAEGLLTSWLYFAPAESFHPPKAMRTLRPRLRKAVTLAYRLGPYSSVSDQESKTLITRVVGFSVAKPKMMCVHRSKSTSLGAYFPLPRRYHDQLV